MKIGQNMLLWTTHVTEEHLPLLEKIKAAGYTGAEIPIHQIDAGHYRALGSRMDEIGLRRTASTCLPGPEASLISAEAVSRQAAVDYLKGVIDCVAALGSSILIGPVYQALCDFTGKPPSEDEYERAAEGLRPVAEHAEAAGVTICLEPLNRFECHLVNTVGTGVQLAKRVAHPNVKVMYDTFHVNIEEQDVFQVIDDYSEWIAHVHISENHRGAPGSGHLPLKKTIERFLSNGYDGWFVVEAFGTALPELAAATRCWRKFFESEAQVLEGGIQLFDSIQ